jgi:nicotinamide mononucleotide adenylyltransferase
MNKKIGITLGKMSPMHKGHELLINDALKIVDVLYVVLYHTPDITSISLSTRADWINQLYDTEKVKVITGWFAPNEHESTERIKRMQEEYIGNLMKDVKLTHFISSEEYGEHMSQYLKIENICLDIDRKELGICATDIRKNLKDHKKYLSPHVYFDLLQKFLIISDQNTKTEFCNELNLEEFNYSLQENKEFKKIEDINKDNIIKRSSSRLNKLKSEDVSNLNDSIIVWHSAINDIIDSYKEGLDYSSEINSVAKNEICNFDHIIVLKGGDPVYTSAVIDFLNGNKIKLCNHRIRCRGLRNKGIKTFYKTSKSFVCGWRISWCT